MGIRYTLSRSPCVGSADSEAYYWILSLLPIIAIAIPPVATPNPSASHRCYLTRDDQFNPFPPRIESKLTPRAAMAMCASAASAVGAVPAFQPAVASSSSSSSLSKSLHAPYPFGFARLELHCSELQIAGVRAEFVYYRGFLLSGAAISCTC